MCVYKSLSSHLPFSFYHVHTYGSKSIQLLKEMEYWASVINPQDCFGDTRGYQHYKQLRQYAEQFDWTGFHTYLFHTCPESHIRDRISESFIKKVPNLWGLIYVCTKTN